jgi:hypothetical protein
MERRDLMGCAGVVVDRAWPESDVGGDGGVPLSDATEDIDFVGGVATVEDEAAVMSSSAGR